jgi:cytochrome c peroxidase
MRFTNSFLWKCLLATLIMIGLTTGAWAQRQILPPGDDPGPGPVMSPAALVGQAIFFDKTLSSPPVQSCNTCHASDVGWVDPRSVQDPIYSPTSEGAVAGRYGKRNAMTVSYADLGPPFNRLPFSNNYVGGRYFDGRAKTALDQATIPFLDRLEMNNQSIKSVINGIRHAPYASQFEGVCGAGIFDNETAALDCIARCLVAFQESHMLNRFSSRYDHFLKGDTTALTPEEKSGLALFQGKGGCAACHPSQKLPNGTLPAFTTHTYENLGVPKNPNNPYYGSPKPLNVAGIHYVDKGLGGPDGGAPGEADQVGKFKIPTLRNVALSAPYSHNGLFTTLYDVVQFHNTRDIDPSWGPPEVAENLSFGPGQVRAALSIAAPTLPPDPGDGGGGGGRLGNLGLTTSEVDQIVAFLKTLNDSFVAP